MVTVRSIFFVLISSLLTFCKPDDSLSRLKRTRWVPEVAMPIASASISIEDILDASDNSSIDVDERNVLTIGYSSTIFSKTGRQLFPLVDKYAYLLPGDKNLELLFNEWFSLQSIEFKGGFFEFELVDGVLDSVAMLRVDFPALINHSSPYQYESTMPNAVIPLDDAVLQFGAGSNLNKADIQFVVYDHNGIDISANYKLLLRFRQMIFKKANGWFDRLVLDFDRDTIELDIFEKWKSGSVFLEDPKAMIKANNSIGIPFTASLETFDAMNHGQGTTIIPIQYQNALGDSFVFEYPNSSDIVGFAQSVYELNKSNSNIQNVIEISPDKIHYDFNLIAHHQVDLDEAGFITDTSKIEIKTALEMPFIGRIEDVTIIDTMPISVHFLKELSKVEEAEVFINTDNSLPLGIDLQIFIVDENQLILDSIFTKSTILIPAEIDGSGYSARSSIASTSIKTSKSQLESLKLAKFLILHGVVNTTHTGLSQVKFEPQNALHVNVSLVAKYELL